MKEVTLKCRVITPLFMGDANMDPEIRTQSINGVIRWWFRTIGGSFEDEKKLFGWGGEKSQKGGIKYILEKSTNNPVKTYAKYFDNKGYPLQNGLNYLSFSLDQRFKRDQSGKPQRKYLDIGHTFTLKIIFSPFLINEDKKKFLSALWCSFYLGNFGSRSRRGFGSITIDQVLFDGQEKACYDDFNFLCFIPQNNHSNWIKENIEKIKKVFNNRFSSIQVFKINMNEKNLNTWIQSVQNGREGKFLAKGYSTTSNNKVYELLNFMGFTLMAYRSYLQPDYDNAKKIISGYHIDNPKIKRTIFGLPLNFYFSSIKRGGMIMPVKISNGKEENLRRASPLIFKILKVADNSEGLIIYIKKYFLPENIKLKLRNKTLKTPDYSLIDNYISSLKNKNLLQEVFNA